MQAFANRHIGTAGESGEHMSAAIGVRTPGVLVTRAIPHDILARLDAGALPEPVGEAQVRAELAAIAAENTRARSLIGLGYYGTETPAVIQRNVLENPSWYTAYTPYQPEISQGRLEALINFQTMVMDMTGMSLANASMLDEATAVVEAMMLARRADRSRSRTVFLVDTDIFPQTRAVLETRAAVMGITLAYADVSAWASDVQPSPVDDAEIFGVLVQYPGASGCIRDVTPVVERAHGVGALAVVAADILALALLQAPGACGADVAVGSTQRFGVPMGFGGPHAGYLAVRVGLERQMPGRLVGVSHDADGNPAYRLALQTREQHIRREKATSNICTAQVLLAVMASMYAVYHGPEGIRQIAQCVADKAERLATALRHEGLDLVHTAFFDTLQVRVPRQAEAIVSAGHDQGINLWLVDADTVQLSVDETTTEETLDEVAELLAGDTVTIAGPRDGETLGCIPAGLVRGSDYLTHPVFSAYHSETAMMRYLKRLADSDYALDRGMIPLGSCTMKLNAATEMAAITWPAFADIHPFAPLEQVAGYQRLITDLEQWLCAITGYDAVSLQPNAGSQGELSGLLAIRGYHDSRGDTQRTICLIPSSAHGTNAASAALAGMRVVVVACDDDGNIDLADLEAKIEASGGELAALMITYPSTHGVYEHHVSDICRRVHDAGGQVYVDGANLNALVGFAQPGRFGGDVSHLNLHKTFCIPHGGGGPGVGPVVARSHLAPFLPGHPLAQWGSTEHPVAAAPFGSASILPISWAYVRLMGAEGLRQATAHAVLAANYVSHQLTDILPTLYRGKDGFVAHECILDVRPLTHATGVTVDDIAKRLVDFGFHAPTMSFPVAGTLMVEPTESEDQAELDRFIQAMRLIWHEAQDVASGVWPADDNPLVNAPHTARCLISEEWTHPYTRERAAYPWTAAADGGEVPQRIAHKYWPPVRRIDGAYGDRHLVCSCPPPEAFAS